MTREEAIDILLNTGFFGRSMNDIDGAIDMAVEALKAEPNSCKYWDGESHFCALRRPQAEPVKHGRWLPVKIMDDEAEFGEVDGAQCSICDYTEHSEYWAKTYYHYCPNCGARMDLNEVEE